MPAESVPTESVRTASRKAESGSDQAAPLRWGGLAWRAAAVAVIVIVFVGYIVTVHGTGRADGTDGSAAAERERAAAATGPIAIATGIKRVVGVFGDAGDAQPYQNLTNPNRQGAPLTFLVEQKRPGWVHVLLPNRPNESTGWIRTSDVGLSHITYRIDVSVSRHQVTLRKGTRTVFVRPAATGAPKTPTPTGRYYITVLLRPPDQSGAYGPYAFGLSAYSNVLFAFGGGPGQVGLHGTNEPSSLGHAASNGCIRVSDATVNQLAKTVPLGTPVTISR